MKKLSKPRRLPWYPDPLPPRGYRYRHDGQSYVMVGAHPYVTTHHGPGRTVTMIEWRTECPTCGTAFIATAVADQTPQIRRCKACQKPGYRVTHERRKADQPSTQP
jgi:hypothetical protein